MKKKLHLNLKIKRLLESPFQIGLKQECDLVPAKDVFKYRKKNSLIQILN
jgi:hypothetical protein